jgi:hypothetical protein
MSKIQSVLFDIHYWTPKEAKYWLKMHGMEPIKRVHATNHFLHYRLREPSQFSRLRIKRVGKHIEFIIGFY